MGDPKFSRQQYEEPTHPWMGDRIEREDEYVRKYGLKNKREFWKAESMLRQQRAQARQYLPLVLRDDEQGKREADNLLGKLHRLGILGKDADLDDVLALDVDAVLSRRLQTLTFLKGLANTPRQARQFIVHGHIAVDGQRVDVPGYLVEREEEDTIQYAPNSPMRNEAHPLHQGVDRPEDIGMGTAPDIEGPGTGPEEPETETEPEAEDAEEVEEPEAEAEEEEAEDEESEPEAETDEAEQTDEEPEAEPDAEEVEEPDAEEVEEPDAEQTDEADEAEEEEAEAEGDADEADAEDDAEQADTDEEEETQ